MRAMVVSEQLSVLESSTAAYSRRVLLSGEASRVIAAMSESVQEVAL